MKLLNLLKEIFKILNIFCRSFIRGITVHFMAQAIEGGSLFNMHFDITTL